ncbi:UNVERIFIED_CONTAM: hypothetical protein Q9R58_22095 [Methylobacteriaceae bacterium AG10]|nr:hypothetical protein [Methylobacteriaceae bacterium AG10]
MPDDTENRLQALEWLIAQVATDGILGREDPLAAAQSLIDDSHQLSGDLIRMVRERGGGDDMHLAVIESAGARDALVEHIYTLVEAGVREREANS